MISWLALSACVVAAVANDIIDYITV